MLSMSVSTGMAAAPEAAAWRPAADSGVCMGWSELGGRNWSGNLGVGRGAPAGMGSTISGVTITMSSVFCFSREMDWKNLPRMGMELMNGTF